jgi:hypothetical protein
MLEAEAKAGKKPADLPQVGSMTVRPYAPVLPGHLWIGIEDKN